MNKNKIVRNAFTKIFINPKSKLNARDKISIKKPGKKCC